MEDSYIYKALYLGCNTLLHGPSSRFVAFSLLFGRLAQQPASEAPYEGPNFVWTEFGTTDFALLFHSACLSGRSDFGTAICAVICCDTVSAKQS